MSMFKPLQPDFNLKRLVMSIAALWLQVTVLVIFCCISSPRMSTPANNVDTLQQCGNECRSNRGREHRRDLKRLFSGQPILKL
jgi:hypothetical protein